MKYFLILQVLLFSFAGFGKALDSLYYCKDGNGTWYNLYLGKNEQLELRIQDTQEVYQGSYTFDGNSLTFKIPAVGVDEKSVHQEVEKDFLITFTTPTVGCSIIGHARGPGHDAYVKCPSIRHIPSISYETNAFELYPNHMVKRREWKELVGIGDTVYSESFGIYYIEGNQIYMAFGQRDTERFLSGTIHGDTGFTINELEPQKGPCKVTK